MNVRLLCLVLGQATMVVGMAMLLPLIHALFLLSPLVPGLFAAFLVTMTVGEIFARYGKNHPQKFELMDAAGVMVLIWPTFSLVGMLPFLFTGLEWPIDAFFESVSCLTSTGISLLEESAPNPIFVWRCLLSWIGSLTFIILLVTVAPPVCGSLGLVVTYEQSLEFSPMIRRMQRASLRALKMYGFLTGISLILFLTTGIGVVEAVKMALMSISTGGWSEHNVFLLRNDPWLEAVASFSMMLASVNFLLYWQAVRQRSLKTIFRDGELRVFVCMAAAFAAIIAFHLWYTGTYGAFNSIRYAIFHVLSFSSTSGFLAADVTAWPDFDRFALLLLVAIGGCIGSLSGGFKVKRMVILFKMTFAEMRRSLHPHMVSHIGIGDELVPLRIVMNILCYFFVHISVVFVFTLLLSIADIRLSEAVGIALAMISSVGSASGLYGADVFTNFAPGFKLTCCVFMMIGRIEVFALMLWLAGEFEDRHKKW
ncbi:MAG: TrkH family potassium uptake protein [Selenomonadaceae bacterium]